MKTIIAGSRSIHDYHMLLDAIQGSGFEITEVLCGGARGVDALGERWARRNNIPVRYFLADWDTFGKSAGIRRNIDMVENAEALIALWDGRSRGTQHTIRYAKKKGLKVFVVKP